MLDALDVDEEPARRIDADQNSEGKGGTGPARLTFPRLVVRPDRFLEPDPF